MFLRPGLRAKFVLLLLVLLALIFSLITIFLIRINTATLRSRLVEESSAFAALATKPIGEAFVLYRDSGRIKILQQVEKFTDLNRNILNVAVFDLQANSLFQQYEDRPIQITAEAASSFDPIYITNSRGELTTVVYPLVEDFGLHRYVVVYEISQATINANIRDVVRLILAFTIVASAITATVGYHLINRFFLSPIRRVSESALAISQGALEQQIVLNRQDEIGDLAKSVNKMAEALKTDIKKLIEADALKSEFMMIASHNLRTPLTIMSGYLEMLQSNELPREVADMIDAVARATRRLDMFSEDMLTISRIETGNTEDIKRQATPLDKFLAGLIADTDHEARVKKVIFQTRITPGLIANISPPHFRNALWHVLDNAIKFTPEGGRVTFSAEKAADKSLIFKISDTGIGIAENEVQKLFTKFHRGTSTLTYDYEGTGIGLYLTKLIIDQHAGSIDIQSEHGKGTSVAISLPD